MSLTTKNQLPLSNPRTVQMTATAAIEIEAAADGGAGNLLPRFQTSGSTALLLSQIPTAKYLLIVIPFC